MEFWNQNHYSCLKFLSCCLGLWPYQSMRESLIFRIIAVFLFLFQTIPQVKKILDRIRNDWEIFKDDNLLEILRSYTRQGHKFSALYAVSLYTCSLFLTLAPIELRLINILVKSNMSIPKFFIPMEYPIMNIEKYYYEILFVTELSVSVIMLMIITYDLFFFLCAQHICGLFAALGVAIEKVPLTKTCEKDYGYDYLRRCIQIHERAIGHTRLLDEILRWNTFILLGLTMIDMSMIELQLVLHLDDIGRVLKNLIFIGSVMTRFFVVCFVSQRVTDHSIDFQINVINSQWCDTSLKSQKLIQFVMMRSQKPCQLTAGKLLIMSFELFTVIVKTSGSYFTMLLAMQ
ncbi:odorant receptor 82a-like [Fopius arisanus]|uniref:Odorant receptor n=1 Tax=Fopius arisanus TaxID=64838 RepID=A0A9R1TN31_9HYME|nr:PREDICTED: odorant receptor 82a-like [Fopius arisanus]